MAVVADTLRSSVLQLDWRMENGLVTVTPMDQSRFVIKVRRAVEILQQADRAELFGRQFDVLLSSLAQWLQDRRDIAFAFLTQRDGALAFVVVRTDSKFDDQFEDALSDLDYQIANDPDLNLVKMDAIGLPFVSRDAVNSFLDDTFALEFSHGERR